ncbi:BlaI/MecI/CopY family transcriptional regulator [Labilibaculum antarcticum]|uniref:Uncharacterized protein n=1 Tax=Labilibaculum antarcticum TaxID=1717717 RepID=A0A1Y1CLV4_9BACT|nr:BlaI/MecI/CopY family transcriptional regulator [Labilibaculum antarcticum]BAX81386.1 hypothetical protein ALGA_3086 [Labilibaculum antarcticum]
MNIKSLTKAEEQIMQIIWKLREAVVKDVVEQFEKPKPAYTTVATVLSVLEKKGFVSNRKIGNTKLFTPAISKAEYTKFQFSSLLGNYFGGSFPKMASFFAKENDLDISDLENILKQAEEEMKKDQQKEN